MLKDNIVTKANDLNLRAYRLSRTEQLLVLSVASMIQPQDEDFKIYKLSVKDFLELLDVTDQSKYIELPKITKGLMSKVIEIRKGHSLLQVCWFSSVEHKPGEGVIEVEFSPKLKPYLLNLKDNFVSYALKQVSKLSSKYSIRIYELLKQNQFKKVVSFEMNEFRELIGLDDSIYPRYSNMKPKILLPVQKEINEKTDIYFDFEEIKTSRKVTALSFYIKSNPIKTRTTAMDEISATEDPADIKLEDGIKAVIKIMDKHSVQPSEAMRIWNSAKGDIKAISKVYNHFKNKSAKNFIGLMVDMVKPGAFHEPIKNGSDDNFNNFEQRQHKELDYIDKLERKFLGWEPAEVGGEIVEQSRIIE